MTGQQLWSLLWAATCVSLSLVAAYERVIRIVLSVGKDVNTISGPGQAANVLRILLIYWRFPPTSYLWLAALVWLCLLMVEATTEVTTMAYCSWTRLQRQHAFPVL